MSTCYDIWIPVLHRGFCDGEPFCLCIYVYVFCREACFWRKKKLLWRKWPDCCPRFLNGLTAVDAAQACGIFGRWRGSGAAAVQHWVCGRVFWISYTQHQLCVSFMNVSVCVSIWWSLLPFLFWTIFVETSVAWMPVCVCKNQRLLPLLLSKAVSSFRWRWHCRAWKIPILAPLGPLAVSPRLL